MVELLILTAMFVRLLSFRASLRVCEHGCAFLYVCVWVGAYAFIQACTWDVCAEKRAPVIEGPSLRRSSNDLSTSHAATLLRIY